MLVFVGIKSKGGGVCRAAQIVYRVLCMYVESDEIKIKCLQRSRLFLFEAP